MNQIGPVQLVVVDFGPKANFSGEILGELARLEQSGTIRILDLLFVQKDADSGDLIALETAGEDLGGIIGALLGFAFEGDHEPVSLDGLAAHSSGLSAEGVAGIGESMEPGHSAGFLLVEHTWARRFRTAVKEAGGTPVAEGFLDPEAVALVGAELAAMAELLDEVENEGESDAATAAEEV